MYRFMVTTTGDFKSWVLMMYSTAVSTQVRAETNRKKNMQYFNASLNFWKWTKNVQKMQLGVHVHTFLLATSLRTSNGHAAQGNQ